MTLNRRQLIFGSLAALLPMQAMAAQNTKQDWVIGQIPDKPYDIDLINMELVPAQFRRQLVVFDGPEPAGSLVVDAAQRFLYYVLMNNKALRFGIAVGRQGAAWHGTAEIGRKAKWPGWTPTANMKRKNPLLPDYMEGGPKNPLGARALYLFKDGRDTLYRIHGTNEPSSIGKAVSSGCIRMFNEHIFELFAEVPVGMRVTVR